MDAITGWWDDYFWGSLVVVELFFVALIMTVLFGLIGAGAKLSKNRAAKAIANGYTIVFRGTPEILVLLLFYFGSAVTLTYIAQLFDPEIKFVDFPPFWAGSFAIALIIGSYATETFRGAFLGVDPGQLEAGRRGVAGERNPREARHVLRDRELQELAHLELVLAAERDAGRHAGQAERVGDDAGEGRR